MVNLSLVYKNNEGFYWNALYLDIFFRQIQIETIGQFEIQFVIRPEEYIVVEQEVDVCPKTVVDIIEPLHYRYIFKDLNWRISVFNYIQDVIRLLLPVAVNCFAQYIPYKGLLGKAVRI